MQTRAAGRAIQVVALLLPVALFGCSLLAPSDEELMGGLSKESEAGKDGGEAGSEAGPGDAASSDGSCGATNATCSTNGDCCSGKCRGNGVCL